MRTVTLGRTGLEVTPLAYGTWQFGGDGGPVDERAAVTAVEHARSLGINFFGAAQAYGFGRSERLLGRALSAELRSARRPMVLATKGGLRMDGPVLVRDASPAWLRKGVEASLEALGTDYIDLYQVHWPDPRTPAAETAAALADLVRVQPPCHLFRSDIEADLIPYAAAHRIGVLAYGPQAHGLLRAVAAGHGATIAQLAVAWVLAQAAVQVAIVGVRRPAHLDQSAGARDLTLGQADLAEIDRILAAATATGGPTPEGME